MSQPPPHPRWHAPHEKQRAFQTQLLEWFDAHRRDLPWRHTNDPYSIWVSEIMLQQTQVERVIDYYHRFLKAFPTVQDLAAATWEELLEYWRGLGFYSRGRRMLETARAVCDRHDGAFPRDTEALQALPGIGPYTAGAIQSFAWNVPAPAIDTNGIRILYRVFSRERLDDPKRFLRDWEGLALELIPDDGSRDFHSALMDFGSTVCTSRAPTCMLCPLRGICSAFARGDDELNASATRSKPKAKETLPEDKEIIEVAVAIIRDTDERILISRRRKGTHLAGRWEFPGGKREAGETWRAALKREMHEELGIEIAVRPVWKRIDFDYPERFVRLRFYRCSLLKGTPTGREGQEIRWVTKAELADYQFPDANASIIEALSPGNRTSSGDGSS